MPGLIAKHLREPYFLCLLGVSFGFLALPVVVLWLFPSAFWLAVLFSIGALADFWADYLVPIQSLDLKFDPNVDRLTERQAMIVRARITFAGAVTLCLFIFVLAWAWGRDLSGLSAILMAAIFMVGVPIGAKSAWFAVQMAGGLRFLSDIPFNVATLIIHATREGEPATAAHQRLYEVENAFYRAIAGYRTTFMFRARTDWLREDIS